MLNSEQQIAYSKSYQFVDTFNILDVVVGEAIEIESVEEVSIGLESVKKALRKCQETNRRFS